jgi:hypothetical protein
MISMRIEGLDSFVKSMDERALKLVVNISRTLTNEAKFIETETKELSPQGPTGNLKELIHTTTPRVDASAVTVTVQGGTDYTPYQEYGTGPKGAASNYLPASAYSGPYKITPNGKKALFWKGAAHPVKSVVHYGIRARKFFKNSLEKRIDKAREAIAKAAIE